MSVSSRRLRTAPLAAAFAALMVSGAAAAAPAAVDLVFYAPHFAKIENGSTVSYHFVRKAEDPKLAPSFEDEVNIRVGPQGAENSLRIDLFTGARAFSLPNMSKSGNPIVVSLLEQDVKEMQKELGGSPFYFRNRLRQAVSEEKPAEPTTIEFGGKTVEAWKITLKPFIGDPSNRAKLREFAERTYEIIFSDAVPGGLYAFKTVTPKMGVSGTLLSEVLTVKPEVVKADAAAAKPDAAAPEASEAGK